MTFPAQLITLIRQGTSRPVPPSVHALAREIIARYGDAAQAILFYGSCLRKGDDAGGIVDMYLLVNNYRRAYRRHSYAFFNKLLPSTIKR